MMTLLRILANLFVRPRATSTEEQYRITASGTSCPASRTRCGSRPV
jgi:hypothetical protein